MNQPSSPDLVLREDRDAIALLTLNRADQFNALSRDMLFELEQRLDVIASDDSVRVVIIGANGRAFCAGHDLKEMRSTEDSAFHQELFAHCGRLMLKINQLKQPVIAQVQGVATAAGCQLVASCDLAIASDRARFAVSGINLGLFCSTPAVPLSRNIARKHAMRMLLTGDFITAEEARQSGLVNEVVDVNALETACFELAQKIAAKPPTVIALGKAAFYQQLGMTLEDAYNFASERMACNLSSEEAREGIDAFIEKRQPDWPQP
jgi:enoyl-CoA hydratase/carnithine racemase